MIGVAARGLTTALLAAVYLLASHNGWPLPSARPDQTFFNFLGSWDATFYRRIAQFGYPTALPVDASGDVLPNPWAFLPVFPTLVAGVTALTSLPFDPAAVLLSTIFGLGATLVLYRLLAATTTPRAALWGTILFAFGPLSFVLQVAYAESLMLLLTFASLLALVRRHYLAIIPLGVIASFTRPGALALALALGIHLVVRWVAARRFAAGRSRGTPFPWPDRLRIVAAGAAIAAAGLAWPVVAGAVTGNPDAYLDTELSWWVGFVGRHEFAPLTPWFVMATTFLGTGGVVLVVAVIAVVACWLASRSVRALGHEVQGYAIAYCLYLFAVFLPQQSLFRLVMPLAPLLGDARLTATPARRWGLLGVGIALQPPAILLLWFVGYP